MVPSYREEEMDSGASNIAIRGDTVIGRAKMAGRAPKHRMNFIKRQYILDLIELEIWQSDLLLYNLEKKKSSFLSFFLKYIICISYTEI